MSKMRGAVVIDTDRCKGCNLCAVACPCGVLALSVRAVNHKGYPYMEQPHAEACIGWASCAVVCPDACITVYRTKEA